MYLPTLLLSTFTLLSTAHGCVKMTATISSGLSNTASLVIVDDGVKVCDGRINGCAGVISCSTSPRWNWAYIDMCKNSFDKGPRVQYQNDHGKWEWNGMSGSCNVMNCCGGNIPCTCRSCQYSLSAFC
ncbi:hypothetical protein TWF718_003541 [Orbilia javanica]|uniref:Uncharacterized protein n=1 Tax=Orbilia javanica TaxID=47235 RepID=A0AAN8MEX5_9PEZI